MNAYGKERKSFGSPINSFGQVCTIPFFFHELCRSDLSSRVRTASRYRVYHQFCLARQCRKNLKSGAALRLFLGVTAASFRRLDLVLPTDPETHRGLLRRVHGREILRVRGRGRPRPFFSGQRAGCRWNEAFLHDVGQECCRQSHAGKLRLRLRLRLRRRQKRTRQELSLASNLHLSGSISLAGPPAFVGLAAYDVIG